MPKPRFRPVQAVVNPRQFGRVEYPNWAADSGLTAVERAWALLQHRAAFVAHTALTEQGQTVDDLASAVGEAPSWLRRKLTGQVPADVGDFIGWAAALGVDVWPLLDTSDVA